MRETLDVDILIVGGEDHKTGQESHTDAHFANLEVDYDRELGYPVYMRYTVPTVADGDWTIEARNVVPLN